MAAMEQVEWTCGIWLPVEGEVTDDAIRTLLLDYGNAVVEDKVHIFPPFIQVVEDEDGEWITWFAAYFDPDEPERSVLKRAVLRSYIVDAEGAKYL